MVWSVSASVIAPQKLIVEVLIFGGACGTQYFGRDQVTLGLKLGEKNNLRNRSVHPSGYGQMVILWTIALRTSFARGDFPARCDFPSISFHLFSKYWSDHNTACKKSG